MKKIAIVLILGLVLGSLVAVYLNRGELQSKFFKPTASNVQETELNVSTKAPEVVIKGLEIPWELVFLPSGEMLITERPGRLLRVGADKAVIEISGVSARGEGGLLGLALDPNFAENNFIYLYLTTQSGSDVANQVVRYKLNEADLSEPVVIIGGIPGANNHDGGRIAFGPDGKLYIATGDAGEEANAQDKNSLAGKILRLNADGSVPEDNPFGNLVYSFGHRNVQGLAWDEQEQLWATEHGRSGVQTGFDELNKIEKGGNYGWPDIEGEETKEGMITPLLHSGATETWAPAGMAYLNGDLLFTGLRGEALYVANIAGGKAPTLKKFLSSDYGRLRSVTLGPDGMLYLLTNNRDGRGEPIAEDDRVIRIDLQSLGL